MSWIAAARYSYRRVCHLPGSRVHPGPPGHAHGRRCRSGCVVFLFLPMDAAGYGLVAAFDDASLFCFPYHHCVSIGDPTGAGSLRTNRFPRWNIANQPDGV